MGAAASASSLGDGEKLAIFDAIAASPEALAAVAKLLPASLPEAVEPPPPASPRPAAAPAAAADPGDASEESDEDDDGSDASSAGASSAPARDGRGVSALWSIAGNVPRRARRRRRGGDDGGDDGGATVKVWTAKHPGNVDLVRRCIDGLPDWREPSAEARFGASCQIVWVSKAIDSIRATGKFETVAGTLGPRQIISRFEGMRQGSTRERNSQLQRLRSRPFSTRFG
ncbi:hypothetical protein JL720_16499 [Aureococcus anophagefferens]|nr:hypothetical protein JL720_16499 [Aureococcus anophagefferens]